MSVGQRHRLVADQVQQLTVPYGHLAVWALGQHGFLLKGGRTTVIVDPYLSDSIAERGGHFRDTFARLIPIVVAPQALSIVDMVLVTHHHTDHCDPETLVPLLAASTARLLTSYKAYERLRELGIDLTRVEVPPVDQALMYNDELIVTPVPAAHYDHDPDAHGNPAYLGFIITLNGVTLYHSGDTVIYPGLMERLQAQRIDMMCLPINGRDWVREQQGLVGNMDYETITIWGIRQRHVPRHALAAGSSDTTGETTPLGRHSIRACAPVAADGHLLVSTASAAS